MTNNLFDENLLHTENWETASLSDSCDLFCIVTRTQLMMRLYDESIGCLEFSDYTELFDVEVMVQRIENEAGLILDPQQWSEILASAEIHTFQLDTPGLDSR